MNIKDWKVIQMRNDVKYIKRNVKGGNVASWSLVVNAFLVLLSFVLDRAFSKENSINVIWFIIAGLGIVIPSILALVQLIRARKAESISLRILSAKELIEIFDDEICYMIMSAETFSKNIKEISKINSHQEALFIEFYFMEASYYLNKAVHLILKMDNNLKSVVDEKNIDRHISKERLVNAIRLMASLYEQLFEFINKKTKELNQYSVCLNLVETKSKYSSLIEFVNRKVDILGVDSKTIFSN